MKTISPIDLGQQLTAQPKTVLVDVRTPAEFEEVHASAAKNIPLDLLNQETIERLKQTEANNPIYVICQSGTRAKTAYQKLAKAGLEACHVDGGTTAWVDQGLPIVRGKKSLSLERQVRIAAGSLVVAGAILSLFIHLNWIWLSGFVGAGLLFAGITDTCGMGMLLAKMPWNQRKKD